MEFEADKDISELKKNFRILDNRPKLIRIAMEAGLAKDEASASHILIGIAAISLFASIYLFSKLGIPSVPPPQFREDITPEARAILPQDVYENLPSKYDARR
jgi:hypothetical protein